MGSTSVPSLYTQKNETDQFNSNFRYLYNFLIRKPYPISIKAYILQKFEGLESAIPLGINMRFYTLYLETQIHRNSIPY